METISGLIGQSPSKRRLHLQLSLMISFFFFLSPMIEVSLKVLNTELYSDEKRTQRRFYKLFYNHPKTNARNHSSYFLFRNVGSVMGHGSQKHPLRHDCHFPVTWSYSSAQSVKTALNNSPDLLSYSVSEPKLSVI